jgi:hypothetical protein
MCAHRKIAFFVALALALVSVAPAAAQGDEQGAFPCVGENVAGIAVDVDDASGTVTIDTGDGYCTVTLDGDYNHPIVILLGSYFGDVSPESLLAALETTQGCALYDEESGIYTWADCEVEGALPVKVVGLNPDGSFAITVKLEDDDEVSGTLQVEDPEKAEMLGEALETLTVDWNLDEYGAVIQPGDEIAALHDDGVGFGVIVKVYAIAAEARKACAESGDLCDVTVEDLMSAFQSGVGIGELFKLYIKPTMVGVGHVRNDDLGRRDRASSSQRSRASTQAAKPDDSGPKPKPTNRPDKPDNAGPKPASQPSKPDHAGPKPKSKDKGK